jgi:hypothetical protein
MTSSGQRESGWGLYGMGVCEDGNPLDCPVHTTRLNPGAVASDSHRRSVSGVARYSQRRPETRDGIQPIGRAVVQSAFRYWSLASGTRNRDPRSRQTFATPLGGRESKVNDEEFPSPAMRMTRRESPQERLYESGSFIELVAGVQTASFRAFG